MLLTGVFLSPANDAIMLRAGFSAFHSRIQRMQWKPASSYVTPSMSRQRSHLQRTSASGWG